MNFRLIVYKYLVQCASYKKFTDFYMAADKAENREISGFVKT